MPTLKPVDLAVVPRWRIDTFVSGAGALFWGGVFFWLSWLAADPGRQFGSWLAIITDVPMPVRLAAPVSIAGLPSTLGILEVLRSLRSPVAILGRDAVCFPTLLGWRKVVWKDVVRVTLDDDRFLTFDMADAESGKRGRETIDLFRTRTSRDAIAGKLIAIRPDLATGWPPPSHAPDPLRQEGELGNHIWS